MIIANAPVGQRLVVVGDELNVTALVACHPARAGDRVSAARRGQGLGAIRRQQSALVVLDSVPPEMTGVEAMAQPTPESPYVPAPILSARRDDANRVMGRSRGADDDLTKPSSAVGTMPIDGTAQRVMVSGLPGEPTPFDYRTRAMLVERSADVLAPTTLPPAVWSNAPNVRTGIVGVLRDGGPSAIPSGSRSVAP